MDWLSFLASVVSSLAWPGAVVAIVLVLRHALNRLLPGLNRLRYKDLELEFGRQVAQAKIEVEATPQPQQLPESTAASDGEAAYFQTLAEASPRAAILEAWLPFEIGASRIAEALGISRPERPLQMPRLIEGLKKEGILTEDEARAVTRLRAVRNDVVHAPTVDLPAHSVAEYALILREVTQAMERRAVARKAATES